MPDAGAVEFMMILPVDLLSFNGEVLAKGQHELTWETAREEDSDFFELQRSADGVDWSVIAKLNGAGTYDGGRNYAHTDQEPLEGINLYRLRMVDFDGSHEFSNVIQLSSAGRVQTGNVYPNPFNSRFVISLDEELTQFSIYTVDGREITSSVPYSVQGKEVIVNANLLPAGTYLLRYNRQVSVVVKE